MANKYVKTDDQIDATTASIANRGVKMQDDIHTCGCAIIRRWHDTSDVSKAVKQMNALLVAIPAMGRANAFKAWVEAYATFVWNTDDKCFAYHKARTKISFEDAKAAIHTPFWEFKPEPDYKPMDLDAMIAALIKKAEKRRDDGLTDKDVVPSDKIKALKAIVA